MQLLIVVGRNMVMLTHPDLAEDFEEGMKFVANKDYTKAAELF